jgi:hypothetical protein
MLLKQFQINTKKILYQGIRKKNIFKWSTFAFIPPTDKTHWDSRIVRANHSRLVGKDNLIRFDVAACNHVSPYRVRLS